MAQADFKHVALVLEGSKTVRPQRSVELVLCRLCPTVEECYWPCIIIVLYVLISLKNIVTSRRVRVMIMMGSSSDD
jgi:hypothetical protein